MHRNISYVLMLSCAFTYGMQNSGTQTVAGWEKEQLLKLVQQRIAEQDLNTPIKDTTVPPLIFAATSDEYIESTRALLAAGADANITHPEKQTPLYQATRKIAVETIDALLQAKANPNPEICRISQSKYTPLHALCNPLKDSLEPEQIQKRFRAIQLLIAANADVNFQNHMGEIPLEGLLRHYQNFKKTLSKKEKETFLESRERLIDLFLATDIKLSTDTQDKANPIVVAGAIGSPILSIYTFMKLQQKK